MNQSNFMKYKLPMCKILTAVFLALLAGMAQADIKAVWEAKHVQTKINTIERDDIVYVSLDNIAKFLNCENRVNLRKGAGSIKFENGELDYILSSPYVTVGEKSYNVKHDIIFYRGDYYAPLIDIVKVIDLLVSDDVSYYDDSKTLYVHPAQYNILDLTAQQKLNGLMVEILLTEDLKYDIVKTDDYWLITNIYQGKIDTARFNNKRLTRAIYETKAYQFDNSAQLSIRLRPKDFTFVGKLKENPLRIQIMIKGEGFADTVLSYSAADNMKNNKIDVIVIDPGHGGDDDGAIGPSGIKEKDINLAISLKLKKLLEDEGLSVILTRDDDRFIPLSDRTKIANEAGADMFVSIHCNASATNKNARGYISFFLSDAKTDQARAAAALENAAIQFESKESQRDYVSDIDFILLDMVQSEFLKESSELAALIEQNIIKHTKIDSRGVDQAGFFVLNKAYMPAVLVETAFISNKQDEKLLKNGNTQNDVAEAIVAAIGEFKAKYEVTE
jgi:N-acetylmuramoyl-L-alanine amidase